MTTLAHRRFFMSPHVKRRCMALFCEHLPCCGLSMAAGFLHLPIMHHNPVIEFFVMIAAALGFEYFYHSRTHTHSASCSHQHARGFKGFVQIYGLALALGIVSWTAHQFLFHHHHDEAASAPHVIAAVASVPAASSN